MRIEAKLRNQRRNSGSKIVGRRAVGQRHEIIHSATYAVPILGPILPDSDLFVMRGSDVFAVYTQFLEELLARTHSRENDLDVLAGSQSRQRDHFLRQVEYPNRLAHVENEDIAVPPHGPGLEDEL